MPYFLSNSITEAMTTEEQSVSGMKPILISFFSGASDPAAQAPVRTAFGTRLMSPAAVACLRNLRRLPPTGSFISISKIKRRSRTNRSSGPRRTPLFGPGAPLRPDP